MESPKKPFKTQSPRSDANPKAGFSLLEVLVVIAIISILLVWALPSMTNMYGRNAILRASTEINEALMNARAYAQANNTYVWVGFTEVSSGQSSYANPQASGSGRVAVAIVASIDGTRDYNASLTPLSKPAWGSTSGNSGANLKAVTQLQYYDNIHLAPLYTATSGFVGSGNMYRPAISDTNYLLSAATSSCVTCFAWPLGKTWTNGTGGQYTFNTVIYFDPQGTARIQTANNTTTIGQYFEIGLKQMAGSGTSSSANQAAIQVDCMTGATKAYRP